MKQIFVSIVILVFIGAIGFSALYLRNEKKAEKAAVAAISVPADDLEIPPLRFDGMNGVRQTISSAGGVVSVQDERGINYDLVIPAGALEQSTEIILVPLKTDENPRSLDTGVLVGPENLYFTGAASLEINMEGSLVKNTAPGKAAAFQFIPIKKQLLPQLINRETETDENVSVQIVSNGAYLISFNSTRREALSRLALSNKTAAPLTILESATYLLSEKKQLSAGEKTQTTTAIDAIMTKATSTQVEFDAAQHLAKLLDYESKQPSMIASLPSSKTTTNAVPKTQLQTAQHYADSVIDNEYATAVQIAYALHTLDRSNNKNTAQTATTEARLKTMLKEKFTTKTIEAPSSYDFADQDVAPLAGYDWSLIGRALIQAIYNLPNPSVQDLNNLHSKIEQAIHENQIQGQAICSYYEVIGFKRPECLPYIAAIQTAESQLQFMADSVLEPSQN